MSFVTRGLMVVAAAATIAVTSSAPLTAVDGNTARRRPVVAPAAPAQPTTSAFTTAQMEYYLGEDGVVVHPSGPQDQGQLDHDPGRSQTGRRRQPHRRLRPAARPPRQDHAGRRSRRASSSLVRTRDARLHLVHHAHVDRRRRQPERGRDRGPGGTDSSAAPGPISRRATTPTSSRRCSRRTSTRRRRTRSASTAARNLTDILGKNYYANVEYDFRPDGADASPTSGTRSTDARLPATATTRSRCHGGSRRDVKLCVLCHSPRRPTPTPATRSTWRS